MPDWPPWGPPSAESWRGGLPRPSEHAKRRASATLGSWRPGNHSWVARARCPLPGEGAGLGAVSGTAATGTGSDSTSSTTKYDKSDTRPIVSRVAQAMLAKYGALIRAAVAACDWCGHEVGLDKSDVWCGRGGWAHSK